MTNFEWIKQNIQEHTLANLMVRESRWKIYVDDHEDRSLDWDYDEVYYTVLGCPNVEFENYRQALDAAYKFLAKEHKDNEVMFDD